MKRLLSEANKLAPLGFAVKEMAEWFTGHVADVGCGQRGCLNQQQPYVKNVEYETTIK